ncbi:hypothetical protein J2X01_004346 [Arthrobacter ginsengisoli]|uniref:Uncharacterized protein n=1 Tax=Arthrobacter ginsengisoli TaxID=1356565 RepID=A0ABU1UIK7_9MICC|nr:hypothetical protein [Arthrobacter ginsengisoli]MDR7085026.1 hypothetical protein [Arthrobacter ginsengisoli]
MRSPSQFPAWRRFSTWAGLEWIDRIALLNTPCPAGEVIQVLLTHIRPALADSGDEEQVTVEVARILASGTGSRRQREIMMSTQSLPAVVLEAIGHTHGTATAPHRPSRRLQTS